MTKGRGMTPTAWKALRFLADQAPCWITTREIQQRNGRSVWLWRGLCALRDRGYAEEAMHVLKGPRPWPEWEPELETYRAALGRDAVYEWLFAHRVTEKGLAAVQDFAKADGGVSQ